MVWRPGNKAEAFLCHKRQTKQIKIMQNNVNNLTIQDANAEIQQKIREYFNRYGMTREGQYGTASCDGCMAEDDWCMFIDGSCDSFRVDLAYTDFKPKRSVIRDIMALDDRIESVNCWRNLSYEEWDNAMDRVRDETIYVMIDGTLQRTTVADYALYMCRNIDYLKLRNGKVARR